MLAGVDSLAAVRIASWLREASGAAVSSGLVLEHPSVRTIAAHLAEPPPGHPVDTASLTAHVNRVLRGGRRGGGDAAQVGRPIALPTGRVDVGAGVGAERRLPCSGAQQSLLVHQRLQPASTAYNQPITVSLQCALAEGEAHAVLAALLRRHAALRTHYALDARAGIFYQMVAPAEHCHVLPACLEQTGEWHEETEQQLRTPFDLFAGVPPVRVAHGRFKGDAMRTSCLRLVVHHVAVDLDSMAIVRSELAEHAAALMHGRALPPPPPFSLEYAEYALWESVRGRDDASLTWWRTTLDGVAATVSLPLDHPRPSGQESASAHVRVCLDAALCTGVKAMGAAAAATLNSTLLAMWTALLLTLSGDDDVVVGLPHSMRHSSASHSWQLLPLVGMLVMTLPIRLALPAGESALEACAATQRAVSRALEHAHVPLHEIVSVVCAGRRHAPLFQSLFQVNSFEAAEARCALADLEATPAVKLDLEVSLFHCNGEVVGALVYDPALFDESTVHRWVGRYCAMAACAVQEPKASLRCLRIRSTSADELRLLLWKFNDTSVLLTQSAHVCVHTLVEEQAALTPNAVALEWNGDHLTYAELMQCSSGVAEWLRACGIAADDVVALQLHRSLEQVVGMLGVLRSGGAYLPLDVTWPADRRRFMVEDAQCAQLVAQSVYLPDVMRWFGATVLVLDDARSPLPAMQEAVRPHRASRALSPSLVDAKTRITTPQSLAYVMYTSGSTGLPKGVMVPHAGVVNLLLGARARYASDASTIFGVPTPYVFDVSVYNIFASLVVHCGRCRLLQDGSSLLTLADEDNEPHWWDAGRCPALPAPSAAVLSHVCRHGHTWHLANLAPQLAHQCRAIHTGNRPPAIVGLAD